jgi:hypothetical protein
MLPRAGALAKRSVGQFQVADYEPARVRFKVPLTHLRDAADRFFSAIAADIGSLDTQ